MGYYTQFELEIFNKDGSELNWDELEKVEEILENWIVPGYGKGALLEIYQERAENFKWYGREKDMIDLSLTYPDYLFLLSGEGEENGDIWKMYFLAGKCARDDAQIVHREFDLDEFEFVENVTISKREYEALKRVDAHMNILDARGVDNWYGYCSAPDREDYDSIEEYEAAIEEAMYGGY